MKLLLFSGTHPRHLFVNQEIIKHFDQSLVIVMEREGLIPNPPLDISDNDKYNFIKHFNNREKKENAAYSKLSYLDVFKDQKKVFVKPEQLNSIDIAEKVKNFDADICMIFGVDLILGPVINVLPDNKINLHLGLSPWYKGGATLFWPFYFLKPQFAGITFHQITKSPDQGEIIHQSTPDLEYGDTIHDIGVKCVLKAKQDVVRLINHFKKTNSFSGNLQKSNGRVWRKKDFHPSHLRVIYDLFDDDIVDHYLDGLLNQEKPNLVSCLPNSHI